MPISRLARRPLHVLVSPLRAVGETRGHLGPKTGVNDIDPRATGHPISKNLALVEIGAIPSTPVL